MRMLCFRIVRCANTGDFARLGKTLPDEGVVDVRLGDDGAGEAAKRRTGSIRLWCCCCCYCRVLWRMLIRDSILLLITRLLCVIVIIILYDTLV